MDSAVQPYEGNRRKSKKDAFVAAELGKAFVVAHNYTKAIEQYERALQHTENSLGKLTVSYDLAGKLNCQLANSFVRSHIFPHGKH
jgi:hypothetical protein